MPADQRLERLATAIEDIATGIAALSHHQKGGVEPSPSVRDYVTKARAQLRERLAEFLMPAIRVVDGAKERRINSGPGGCPVCLSGPGKFCWERQAEMNNCPTPRPPKERA